MNKKDPIVKTLEKHSAISGAEIARILGITRQGVNKRLQLLINNGQAVKTGISRGAKYSLVLPGTRLDSLSYKAKFRLPGLEEDRVFDVLGMSLRLSRSLRNNVHSIVRYTFLEMLNNAIDHSRSDQCLISVFLEPYRCRYVIRDQGIGLFYSVYKKFKLSSETDAVGQILKGKTTTMPGAHSGEGIFFSSKLADRMIFRSHDIQLIIDNVKNDNFISKTRAIKGTEVVFEIRRSSKRQTSVVFNKYAPERFDYRFEKTTVAVKLYPAEYLSRSEARRLLSGLEKFKEIVLDFKNVKTIGQGFADEVFRVFQDKYPGKAVHACNVLPVVRAMINHVVDNKNIIRVDD
jgi:biotin operon repressor/anti-sigma regulatory factor (Ser/Thr protein kinase)/uncharacterized protein (DUF1330 family)